MSRSRSFRDEGVILKRSDFGEADRLLTIYTKEHGKIQAIAKGARKPQSRKTGHVELFMRTAFLLAIGRGEIFIVTQAELIESYEPLRASLIKMSYASYLVELLDKFTAEHDVHERKYQLLVEGLGWMAAVENSLLCARYYELRLLSLLGYQPQLFHCVGCGKEIVEQDQYFSAELGGILDPECRVKDYRARPISAVGVKLLRFLQTRVWEQVNSLNLKRPLHQELEQIMHYYLMFLLERNLKSVDFLHRLRRELSLLQAVESDEWL